MRKRTKLPIESFGPELMTALIAGSTKEVRLPMAYCFAVTFRRRIHMLRARMREENHPQAALAERAQVSVLWGKEAGLEEPEFRKTVTGNRVPNDKMTPAIVRLKPYDSEFAEALKAAGVDVDVNVGSDLQVPGHETHDPLAAFDPTRSEN